MKATFFLICGVILPFFTFFGELVSGFCASNLFDPMANWPMIVAVFSVPTIMLIHFLKQKDIEKRIPLPLVIAAIGWSLAISAYYCFIFGPLIPIGAIAILWFGIGLLPTTPFFAFVSALVAWKKAGEQAKEKQALRLGGIGFAAGCAFLLVVEGPSWLTNYELSRLSENPTPEKLESVSKHIKALGSVKSCHRRLHGFQTEYLEPARFAFSWVGRRGGSRDIESARQVYYRITGKSGNEKTPWRRPTMMTGMNNRGRWDPNVGGDSVAQLISGLSLRESFVSGKIESASGLAYQEWTVELENRTMTAQEGRCLVLLPPGSVVSRLTLWVNGEPREAAFAQKSKVKAAYQSVAVVQRKDPVLVQWAGPNRIFVQCFPVPENGGTLKYRIGYISPAETIVPNPPLLVDRNFEIPKSFRHTLRYHSDQEIDSPFDSLELVDHPRKGSVLMGQLSTEQIARIRTLGKLQNSEKLPRTVWTEDKLARTESGGKFLVRENVATPPPLGKNPASEFVFVVDSSIAMKPFLKALAGALENLPPETRASLVICTNKPQVAATSVSVNSSEWADAIASLQKLRCSGGIDNSLGLARALDLIKPGTVANLVWFHGPQPVETSNITTNRLRLSLDVRPDIVWSSFSVAPGSNFILNNFSEHRQLQAAVRLVDPNSQISKLVEGKAAKRHFRWARFTDEAQVPSDAVKVDDVLARFHAFEQAKEILASGKWKEQDTKNAAHYQLVTPFTGAVVLETQQQFKQNGLDPVDPSTTPKTPSVPEPEFYLLLIFAGGALLLLEFKRRLVPA